MKIQGTLAGLLYCKMPGFTHEGEIKFFKMKIKNSVEEFKNNDNPTDQEFEKMERKINYFIKRTKQLRIMALVAHKKRIGDDY